MRSEFSPVQLARLLRLPEPTLEQAAVIGAPLGPMAVIAGAGSGKSETMAARLVWLVANGHVRPDRVLGLTFTRKAAAELADRVRSRLDRLRRAGLEAAEGGSVEKGDNPDDEDGPQAWSGEPVIGTYHAYAGRLVADHALREGIEPSLRLITPAPAWQLAASIVAAYDGPMDQIGWTPQTVTAAVLSLAGDLAEHLRSPADVTRVGAWLAARAAALPRATAAARKVLETQAAREQLLPLVDRYAQAKAAREVLDHGDQMALAARIASRHPEVGMMERGRYQVVLLDEYQDTSHAQLVLLESLFGGGHPVTAVGDPCQSIYGWRGASAGNLVRFTEDFRARNGDEAPVRRLATSFRNAGQVLDVAAALQVPLRAQAPDVPLLIAAPDRATRGAVTCALLPTLDAEAAWVARQAEALLARPAGSAPDGQPWPDGRASGVRPSDIAVLCRKRSQFEALRRSLTARGIPCEVVGLGGLLTVPEVQDVVATLRVMHDASASDSLARILTGPRWRIGPRDLVALGRRARDLARGLHDADAEDEETDQESAGSPSAATAGEARTPSSAASATLPATPPGAGSSAAAPAPGQLPAMGPDTAAGSSSGAAPSVPGRSGPVAPPAQRSSPAYRSDGTPWPDEPSGDDDSWADAPLPPGPEDGWQPGPDDAGGRPAPAPRAAGPAGPASSASGSRATAPAGLATPLGRTAGPGPAATPGDQARATGGPGPVAGEPDAIDVAVNDLTAQSGSLVEALDDPGEPEGYSATGHARMRALARELRRLREHVSRPLPDLIAEVERALSLDIEVAARPGVDAAGARADLDKFTDVAAAFAGEQAEATLGAFLAYLTAAQQEEFGLETGQVGEADTVKLLTVHAAKGLQWPAVFVPGLSGGAKSQVFPAKPRQSTKWTDNSRLIPFGLRGDSADLPALDDLDSDGLAAFNAGCAARDVSEERRLAYVAATRAAFWLGCSGYWWGEGTAPLGPSVFLREARAACEAGAGTVGDWADPPGEEAENPLLATIEEADWPVTPAGQHYAAITTARQLVAAAAGRAASGAAPGASAGTPATAPLVAEAAAGDGAAAPARRRRRPAQGDMDSLFSADELASPPAPEDGLTPQERELVAAWDLDAGLLLAERERQLRRGDGPVPVLLPARLSVSALVALARDPDGLARQVRRPMPQPPARQARRGTAFHHWLEERFGQQRLIADDDLFADPDEGGQRGDTDLARLRDRFEASEWGSRFPREVEVPFDTLIGDRQIRGRIDAVFSDAGGNYDVVDWKTGQPPRTQPERDAVAVQLAAYRLAWATLAGVPLDRVRAAFYYVRWNVTVRPADLLDEAGLKALIDRVPVID